MNDSNKKVLLAFGLSFLILVLWRFVFPPPPPVEPPPAKSPTPVQTPAPTSKPAAPTSPSAAKPAARVPVPVALAVQQGSQAEEIVVENSLARITLSTEGAVVKSWVLKKFKDETGQPLDVVNRKACETLGFPMSLGTPDAETTKKLNSALYVVTPKGSALAAPGKLEFVYSDGKVQARKVLSFSDGYDVHVEASLFDGQRYLLVEVAWPGGFGDHSLPPQVKESMHNLVHGSAEKIESESQHKIKDDQVFSGPLPIAGMTDRYFALVYLPDVPEQVALKVGRRTWNPPDWKEKEPPRETFAALASALPQALGFRIFVGPKDLDVLKAMRPPLDKLVDYGWFSFVAKPLFLAMRYIHDQWIHNFGWAIVLLTVLINMALFPIKLKQIRSAQEMQRVAPIVKGIQDKYKNYKFNDPRKQKMNQEVMKVYQEHGVNPLSGCLPMVVQLPFLYGFYRVLDTSIELRHAPWILWIHDLSAKDHLYILPVLMVITMFLLQKMTPTPTADPAQQRMFMLMPLFMGFMFMNFASGLVLYWLTGNVIGIGQQMIINRLVPKAAPPSPPRKGAAKEN